MNNNETAFPHENLSAAIDLWNRAAISLLDIRHNLISPEQPLCNYLLPASTFLFTCGEKAEVVLNNTAYNMERFGLFHGGKGTELSIKAHGGWLEYYMVFYKAGEPVFHRGEYLRLIKEVNPFRQQYGFKPHNPLFFSEELCKMYEKWKGPTPLNVFYGKAAFYRFVYEIYEELEKGNIQVFQPDIISMARRYLDSHYREAIVIQELCQVLGVSYSHFHRSFKQQIGMAPQNYLIKKRLDAAKKCLETSNASVREIALHYGFADEYSLYRLFMKNIGLAPGKYRETSQSNMIDYSIGNLISFPYNEERMVSYDKLEDKGASLMFRQIRNKAVIMAAVSLMLMVSACSTQPVNTKTTESAQISEVATETPKAEANKKGTPETKTIHMKYGDVEIPADPKRVVVIFVQGDLLALGVTPVATSFNTGSAFEPQTQEVSVIDAFSINEEEIMALDPDLILWNTEDEQTYEKLSKIAPTLASDYFSMDYRERLRFFGDVFNRSEKAEELIQTFDEKLASSKAELEKAGLLQKSFICVDIRDGFLRAFQGGRGGRLVYDFLGFPAPEKLQAVFETEDFKSTGQADLSFEAMPEYVGDYILLNTDDQLLSDNPVWNNLPAVKEGRLIKASKNLFWFNDIISMTTQLDIIVNAVLETK
uniref:AraC family transcriptional regulator n=1 Tax=Clostridium sp. 12(A) TaxID=1163671 RepID=UPI0004659216|nr:AraC family transcriptional regulator [Clostridium sp. 12(A)]